MRFNTYNMVPTLQRCLSILMFCFTPSGVQDHVNIETVDLDYWDGSSTWSAVVSTLSSFESLISPNHWLKKNSASNIPKKFHQPRKLKMKFKIWEQSMQGDQNSNTESKHTTQPEPWTPAPEALIFAIRLSKDPNCDSIADARFPSGGSPPPSCKICRNFCQGSYSASRFLALCP